MRHRIIGLFAANTLTFLVVGASFIIYSKLLSPSQFGLYAAALSGATILALILDGGLKTSIIKMEREISDQEEASIAVLMLVVSLALILALILVPRLFLHGKVSGKQDMKFVASFVGLALFFYPFVTLPTAKLERRLEYGHIAWIESAAMLIERAFPAVLLLWTSAGLYSFVIALFISRLFRASVLSVFHPLHIFGASSGALKTSLHLLKEGGWIQAGTLSAVARDNLHTLLIGPLFGKEWIGYYAWALQICLMSSQLFAQISARVSLPILAQSDSFEERWPKCLYQVRLLTILTVPVLCGVWFALPAINDHLFHGKWRPALVLVPLLFLRMIPGLATTPLGPLIMVHRGGYAYAKANILWTLLETFAAGVACLLLGPTGLAWSYAVIVWAGLWLMLRSLGHRTVELSRQMADELFKRPSLLCACGVLLLLSGAGSLIGSGGINFGFPYVFSILLVMCSYLSEPDFRRFVIHEKTQTTA